MLQLREKHPDAPAQPAQSYYSGGLFKIYIRECISCNKWRDGNGPSFCGSSGTEDANGFKRVLACKCFEHLSIAHSEAWRPRQGVSARNMLTHRQ